MRFTNRMKLPEPIVKAVTRHPYTKGKADFSVTELIGPARLRVLKARHADEIVEDVADRLWALYGSIGHGILEQAAIGHVTEHRFFSEIEDFKGRRRILSGQADLLPIIGDESDLVDYKFVSTWTVARGLKPEWGAQLNAYQFLAQRNGVRIRDRYIVTLFRDWSRSKAKTGGGIYPRHPARVFPVGDWGDYHRERYIRERLTIHLDAESSLPECDPDERWVRGKKAISIRCRDYCPVAPWCDQWKAENQPDGTAPVINERE